jgi:thiol-disulfide isomerase/thioredoxin
MAIRRREALLFAGVGVAAAAAGIALGPLLRPAQGEAAELLATEFLDLAGQRRRLSDWRGQALVCNFWATWCPPCVEEMPLLARTRKKYASKSVEFVGIALDSTDKVGEFIRRLGVDYPILIAESSALDLMKKLGNRSGGLPFTVFLNSKGVITHKKLGAVTEQDLESLVGGLVSDKDIGKTRRPRDVSGGDMSY